MVQRQQHPRSRGVPRGATAAAAILSADVAETCMKSKHNSEATKNDARVTLNYFAAKKSIADSCVPNYCAARE
jgi:hypothetical protein